jgi:intracellular septation protein A
MTRTAAICLSFLGPLVPMILIFLFFSTFDRVIPTGVDVAGAIILVASVVFIRIYFAAWYARDKGRSGALGLLSLFGLLGWLVLIFAQDRKRVATLASAATDGTPL